MSKFDDEDFDIVDPDFDFEYDDDETLDREHMISSRSEERAQGFMESYHPNMVGGYNFPDWKHTRNKSKNTD